DRNHAQAAHGRPRQKTGTLSVLQSQLRAFNVRRTRPIKYDGIYDTVELKAGDTITIAPRPNTCWEPDIICETCAPPPPHLVSVLFVISAVSGLLFSLLVWGGLHALRRHATSS